MSGLNIVAIAKAFAGRPVLDDVSLSLEPGERLALVGPSGCGKSTLLRIVAGLESPDRGRIEIDDIDVTDVPTHRRGVGMVFQDDQLFPHLDVADNVAFALRVRGVGRAERTRRVAELLGLVGLGHLAEAHVGQLSGGEAKRVALARSLAIAPRVLLLDEPLTGLDRERHDSLMTELGSILNAMGRETGTSVLLVTHDPAEADFLAGRVVRLTDRRDREVANPVIEGSDEPGDRQP